MFRLVPRAVALPSIADLHREIEERKRAENEVRSLNAELERRVEERTAMRKRSNDALQRFAYVASHDLQEPIRTIKSFNQLLAREYEGKLDSQGTEYIGFVLEASGRMQTLVEMPPQNALQSGRNLVIVSRSVVLNGGFLVSRRVLAIAVSILALVSTASASTIVVPGAQTSVEGNSNNGFPFNIANFGLSSQRYQQVYGAAAFGSTPVLITQLLFRPDASSGSAFSSTLSDIQINMSTTSSAVDALSATYASNVGGNDTVVYARGSLALSSSFTGAGPKDFDIVINLTTPFLYDPSAGNLLLDVRNFGGGLTTQFDAQNTSGDSVSRVYTNNGVGSATGIADTSGLVTEFVFTNAVPEPASIGLLSIGLAALGYSGLRRKR